MDNTLTPHEQKILDNTVNGSWNSIALVRADLSYATAVKCMRKLVRLGYVRINLVPHWRLGKRKCYEATAKGVKNSCWA